MSIIIKSIEFLLVIIDFYDNLAYEKYYFTTTKYTYYNKSYYNKNDYCGNTRIITSIH
jgi:hypothetical protein